MDYQFQDAATGLFGRDLPGQWKSSAEILKKYRWIFLSYKLWGESGLLKDYLVGKMLKKVLKWTLRTPIPGWHDLHAKHSTASTSSLVTI